MSDINRGNRIRLDNYDRFLKRIYFLFKPLIPRRVQIYLRRGYISRKRSFYRDTWPIDEKANLPPKGWDGWPEGKRFALILTHDVETGKGQERCIRLADLERNLGFRASFNFVAKEYKVLLDLREYLKKIGFEVGLHGLYHDGQLFRSRKVFQRQAIEINYFLKKWDAVGFRSPSMFHNLDWIGELNIEYDCSTFDTDPFEPQPDGVSTIFPFWAQSGFSAKGFVELPYTLPQDFTLLVLMKERNIAIWKKKLDWIVEKGGMALLITHPDYMNCEKDRCKTGEYPIEFYKELLDYVKGKYEGQYWNPLPKEMARFWKESMVGKGREAN